MSNGDPAGAGTVGNAAESQSERKKVFWQAADTVGKLAFGLFAILMFFLGQHSTQTMKAEENQTQETRARNQQRLGEAELARSLIPLLIKGGSDRDLALLVLSWVAPDQATSMVDALQAAGAPFTAETAARARATGTNRKVLDLLRDASALARDRMDHDNHAEGYRALHDLVVAMPDWLSARLGDREVAAAAAAYARGDFESAARTLDETVASVLTQCAASPDCAEIRNVTSNP